MILSALCAGHTLLSCHELHHIYILNLRFTSHFPSHHPIPPCLQYPFLFQSLLTQHLSSSPSGCRREDGGSHVWPIIHPCGVATANCSEYDDAFENYGLVRRTCTREGSLLCKHSVLLVYMRVFTRGM